MKLNYVILLAISLTAVIYVAGCVSQETKGKYNGGLDNCKTGNYDEERDCYTALAYKRVDYKICEKMPEDVNERQANKAFCLGFIASVTGDLSICRNQENMFQKQIGAEFGRHLQHM